MTLSLDDVAMLRSATQSLPACGMVHNQEDDTIVPYDPALLTSRLQQSVIAYVDRPPRTPDGRARWYALLGPRQAGKSVVGEYAFYPKAAYTPDWDHVTIADKDDRAQYLHGRVQFLHTNWRAYRMETRSSQAVRQLTFKHGGRMRTLSAREADAGIGQSISSLHASECGIWPNGEKVWQLLEPAMLNRRECLALFECTPVPADAASMEWWRDLYMEAKRREGRWFAGFFPYWDSRLCVRAWPKGSAITIEEQRLLDRWGAYGLRLEHLAFRRELLATTFRSHPELFDVFYPTDDQSCWLVQSSGVIPAHVLSRHLARVLVPWRGPVMEYESPQPGGVYIIGADPAGWGVRDHAAFHVFRVWRDELVQVCAYADNVADPIAFASALVQAGRRYNNATIVVESNGVGAGTLALLKSEGYPRLFHEAPYKPGVTTTAKSLEQMTGWLLDGLQDTLTIRDEDTLSQLGSYKHDKRIEDSVNVEQLRGTIGPHRRKRHHWDKVSALLMVMVAARFSEKPSKPLELTPPPPVKAMGEWTLRELAEMKAGQAKPRLRRGTWRVRLRKR